MSPNRIYMALALCFLCGVVARSESRTPVSWFDGDAFRTVALEVERPVYFPYDTVMLRVVSGDSTRAAGAIPVLAIEDASLRPGEADDYRLVIPEAANPGQYRVRLWVADRNGKWALVETDCSINVSEHQTIEPLGEYVAIGLEGETGPASDLITIDRDRIGELRVIFARDRIPERAGPQFVTINVQVMARNGAVLRTSQRRMVAFRRQVSRDRDQALLLRYRAAYGGYATIRPEELDQVPIQVDSVPNWAVIRVRVEPDYDITVGASDRSNSVTRSFRVRGPLIEAGLALGVPKVLWDSRSEDSLNYGNTSAILRVFLLHSSTGKHFPISLGLGTFGVDSPIDVGKRQGGFAIPTFLDMVELMKTFRVNLGDRISAGLELTPFFPIRMKSRLLLNARVGLQL